MRRQLELSGEKENGTHTLLAWTCLPDRCQQLRRRQNAAGAYLNRVKESWQRWDSNPRPRRDWCLKPAPKTTRPRYPCDHRARDRIAFQVQRSQKQQQHDFIDENSSVGSKLLSLVAWPSGLRRWFKAPVSSEAWVRIPLLPIRCAFYCLLKAANAREILIPHLAVQRGHVTILLLFFSSKRHKYSSLLPLFVSNPLL